MVTPIKFTREVKIQNRFNGKLGDPDRSEHELQMDLLLIVRASQGAVVLKVRMQGLGTADPTTTWKGVYEPHNVSGHFKLKIREHWYPSSEPCDVLDIDECYGDTGYLMAKEAWNAFIQSEETGWKFLEETYNEWRKP